MKPPIPPTMWANRQVKWMNSQLRQQIIALLEAYRSAHLAVAGPDGPWATVIPFLGDDLTLFLVETRASDLVYYVENRPEVVLTVGGNGGRWSPPALRYRTSSDGGRVGGDPTGSAGCLWPS